MKCNICGNNVIITTFMTDFWEGNLKEMACPECSCEYIKRCQGCGTFRMKDVMAGNTCIYDNPETTFSCQSCFSIININDIRISNKDCLDEEGASLVCNTCFDIINTNYNPSFSTIPASSTPLNLDSLPYVDLSNSTYNDIRQYYRMEQMSSPSFVGDRIITGPTPEQPRKYYKINGATFFKLDNHARACYVCSRSLKAMYKCVDCDRNVCSVCVERHPHTDFKIKEGFSAGKLINLPHMIGVELEAERGSVAVLGKLLDKDIMFSHDGSLHDKGIEINFPPLRGKNLEKKVNDASKALMKAGFVGTSSCGLHIHIDGSEIINSSQKQVQLIKTIYVMEDLIFSVLPSSRWDNKYCKRLSDYYLYKNFKLGLDQKNLETIWYDTQSEEEKSDRKQRKYDNTRYAGFNLHSLFFRGTVEFRYHSGTVQAKKILYWANLLSHIYDWAINNYDENIINELFNDRTSRDKFFKVFKYVLKLDDDTIKYFFARASKFNPSFYIAFNKGKAARAQDEMFSKLSKESLRSQIYKNLDKIEELLKDCNEFELPSEAKTYDECEMFKKYLRNDIMRNDHYKKLGLTRATLDKFLDNAGDNEIEYYKDEIYQSLIYQSLIYPIMSEDMELRLYSGIVPRDISQKVYDLTSGINMLLDTILPKDEDQKGFIKPEELRTVLNYSRERTRGTIEANVGGDTESQEEEQL